MNRRRSGLLKVFVLKKMGLVRASGRHAATRLQLGTDNRLGLGTGPSCKTQRISASSSLGESAPPRMTSVGQSRAPYPVGYSGVASATLRHGELDGALTSLD
jgi:hypothetical protein